MCAEDGPFLPLVCTGRTDTGTSLTGHRVGGVVSETSFKFFIQFVVYTTVFCAFVLIVTAIYTAELVRHVSVTRLLNELTC